MPVAMPLWRCIGHCVRAIDTTANMVCPSRAFVEPEIEGHQYLALKTFCFLVEHERLGRKILFDCGARKDLQGLAPALRVLVDDLEVDIEAGVDTLLQDANIPLESIDTIIWSHWHWDHIGDCSKFPAATKVVVGPGFKDAFPAGWPKDPECPLLVEDLEYVTRTGCGVFSHEIEEVSFDAARRIEGIRAQDYFADGSFYLLDLPGHAVGHIGALCRTTLTTYILLGGDSCHFLGAMRPSKTHRLPEEIPHLPALPLTAACPCASYINRHPKTTANNETGEVDDSKAHHTPFYQISGGEASVFADPNIAQSTVKSLQALDAHPDIWICFAHDSSLAEVAPLLNTKPQHDLNSWKSDNLKSQSMWRFLKDLWLCTGECVRSR